MECCTVSGSLDVFSMCSLHFSLQSAPVNIIVDSHVWVEDPALAWISGEVFKINGEEVHVHTTDGKTVSLIVYTVCIL